MSTIKHLICFFAFLFLFSGLDAKDKIYLNWQVGYTTSKDVAPSTFVVSTVPGAVQLDIAKAEGYPDYKYADNYKMFSWMEDMYYVYRTEFKKPSLGKDSHLYFISKGIDYQYEIYLNGTKVTQGEGMFSPIDTNITDLLKDGTNKLEVIVFPVPKKHPLPADRTQASNVTKPAVSYGWDWHPRLVPLGIWDETYLYVRETAAVKDVHVRYSLSEDFKTADIGLEISAGDCKGMSYKWKLYDMKGKAVLSSSGIIGDRPYVHVGQVKDVHLWWTHDHGEQYLYRSVFELMSEGGKNTHTIEGNIGFRSIRLVTNEGAWEEPKGYPMSRSVPPVQIELNGRRIFAKGSNWVNPEIFPGTITAERYETLIRLAAEANFNIFRIWGGGIVNKESFFDLCDRNGILVWEEFPLACNNYEDDEHYLEILEQEATSIILRLRKHPCIAIWCGGNELFNNWSKMTDQSLALRLLNSLCFRLSPSIPFLPTSPVMGMAHGCYLFKYPTGEEVFEAMSSARYTAYSEFGVPGASPVEVIKSVIPEDELFPVKDDGAWREHHAFGAWQEDTWLCTDILESYFGKAESLEELVEQSQLLQSEGYKAIYEEARRQKPYCSIAINWCYNEPWPAVANNSLITYPAIVKPAYHAVKNSCRPVCASARFKKFTWEEGEDFTAELWMLNDSFDKFKPGTVSVKIVADGKIMEFLEWKPKELQENCNLQGPVARICLPEFQSDRFDVLVEVDGAPEYNSKYTFLYHKKETTEEGTPELNK